jgi:hypothetical protein
MRADPPTGPLTGLARLLLSLARRRLAARKKPGKGAVKKVEKSEA